MYPEGATVELVAVNDHQAPPAGMRGKVMYVGDIGTAFIAWETGSNDDYDWDALDCLEGRCMDENPAQGCVTSDNEGEE